MDPKPNLDIWHQIMAFVSKNALWLWGIGIGLLGSFSYDLLRSKRFTKAYILGCTGAAIFCGYVGGSYVMDNYPKKAAILIPMITVLSNNLLSAVMSINYKALLQKDWKAAFEILMRKK